MGQSSVGGPHETARVHYIPRWRHRIARQARTTIARPRSGTAHIVDFGRVNVPGEHGHFHVLGISGDQLMRVVGFRDGAETRTGEHRVMDATRR